MYTCEYKHVIKSDGQTYEYSEWKPGTYLGSVGTTSIYALVADGKTGILQSTHLSDVRFPQFIVS